MYNLKCFSFIAISKSFTLIQPLYEGHLCLKLDLCDKNNLQNKLKIRILSETSIPYLIRHASFILIVSLHL